MNRTLFAMLTAATLTALPALSGCDDGDPASATTPDVAAPETPEPEPPPVDDPTDDPTDPIDDPIDPIEDPIDDPIEDPARPGPAPIDIGHGTTGRADLVPPTPTQYPTSRARRRMNIDQLAAAFRRTSGGIGWTERRGNVDVDLFTDLAATLGKPDYIQITSESLEPSALFQKFLDDAARKVCAAIVERDRATPADAVLLPAEGIDPDDHLSHLILRWHGRDLPPDSPDLMHWRWLYDSVIFITADDATAWNAVCATLYTHPDFYSY